MAEKNNTVILTDDEGKEVEFEHLDTIEMNDNCYVILLPVEDEEEGVVILKFETDENGDEFLAVLDSDEEAEAVIAQYEADLDEEDYDGYEN